LASVETVPAQGGRTEVALAYDTIAVNYGARQVFDGFSLSIASGEVVALLGHNGAGKTTAMRVASGLTRQRSGTVRLGGLDLGRMPASSRSRAGLSLVPQGVVGLFKSLTVSQNMEAARPRDHDQAMEDRLREAFSDVLVNRGNQVAGTMSGGQQQILAISLAQLRSPSVLLLDEPSTGLAPSVVKRILEMVAELARQERTTVMLAEQDVAAALTVCSRVCILQSGNLVADFARADCPPPTELWRYF
jgi:branched-chain amino acid transport system ATP-binding protein